MTLSEDMGLGRPGLRNDWFVPVKTRLRLNDNQLTNPDLRSLTDAQVARLLMVIDQDPNRFAPWARARILEERIARMSKKS